MPFKVAVKQPNARIIRSEPDDYVSVWRGKDDISTHREFGRIRRSTWMIVPSIILAAVHDLEIVPVQMEWVLSRVVVVDNDLDDRHVGQDIGECVDSVHSWVGGKVTRAEGGVQRGDFRAHIGETAKEGVVGTIIEVVHHDVQGYAQVRIREQPFVVHRNQEKVV